MALLHNDPSLERLAGDGFVVIDGPYQAAELSALSIAYDKAVASAEPPDKRIGTSTRVWDIVSRIPATETLYTFAPLLRACAAVLGQAFKLSATCFRTLESGAPMQRLHVDVAYKDDGWPILGFILMIDAFSPQNGATRFVPGSHRRSAPSGDTGAPGREAFACGTAGSIIVFDGSTWHGHAANTSLKPRRSLQGHFIRRDATAALDYRTRLDSKALSGMGETGKYVLGL